MLLKFSLMTATEKVTFGKIDLFSFGYVPWYHIGTASCETVM